MVSLAVAATLAMTALAAYLAFRAQTMSGLDDSLVDRARAAADGAVIQNLAGSVPSGVLGAADVRIAVVTPDGSVRSASRGEDMLVLGRTELAVARHSAPSSIRTISSDDGTHWRVVAVPIDGGALVLAQSLQSQERVIQKVGTVMLVFGILGVIVAALAGWFTAQSALRPVRRLTEASEHIAKTLDLRPLRVTGDDEIARLAASFNLMLSALASSMVRQRQLVADAGHELRTPLTSLRTNFELLVQSDQQGGLPPGAREELVGDIEGQLNELSTLMSDLVELAREGSAERAKNVVDLGHVVESAFQRARRRGAGVRFETSFGEPWQVLGEFQSLERAVLNLIDNAIKWSPRGGLVSVTLHEGVLTVDDQGPGIPEEHREDVFERFWRMPDARTLPGSGLGLAIVKETVTAHGGTVVAERSPSGGARFVVRLPGAHQLA
jgi:two-component system sensor histidine kinase MprB